jgi:N-acetylneuraminic acid mutarotase
VISYRYINAIGGFDAYYIRNGNFNTFNDIWEFDPVTSEWGEMQSFPGEGRVGAIGYSIGDQGYMGLGKYYRDQDMRLQTGPLDDFYEFDPGKAPGSQWKRLQSFPGEFNSTKGFALGDIGYVLAAEGTSLRASVSFWKFDRNEGETGTWSEITSTLPPLLGLPSAVLSVGSVAYIYFAGPEQNFWMYVPELI